MLLVNVVLLLRAHLSGLAGHCDGMAGLASIGGKHAGNQRDSVRDGFNLRAVRSECLVRIFTPLLGPIVLVLDLRVLAALRKVVVHPDHVRADRPLVALHVVGKLGHLPRRQRRPLIEPVVLLTRRARRLRRLGRARRLCRLGRARRSGCRFARLLTDLGLEIADDCLLCCHLPLKRRLTRDRKVRLCSQAACHGVCNLAGVLLLWRFGLPGVLASLRFRDSVAKVVHYPVLLRRRTVQRHWRAVGEQRVPPDLASNLAALRLQRGAVRTRPHGRRRLRVQETPNCCLRLSLLLCLSDWHARALKLVALLPLSRLEPRAVQLRVLLQFPRRRRLFLCTKLTQRGANILRRVE